MPRQHDQRQVREDPAHHPRDVAGISIGQRQVEERHVEGLARVFQHGQRAVERLRLDDIEAMPNRAREQFAHGFPVRAIVVHVQHEDPPALTHGSSSGSVSRSPSASPTIAGSPARRSA